MKTTSTARSIYVARSEIGPVKIGIARNPRYRMSALRVASPWPVTLEYCGECEGDAVRQIETKAHKTLAAHHTAGEWFKVTVKEAVCAVLEAARELGFELRQIDIRKKVRRGGRPKLYSVRILLPLADRALEDIETVLAAGETRLDFIRAAIEREIKRRERL